jgi:ABC-2 type transport system ATP-binding protein
VSIRNLTKTFGSFVAVDNVSFDVEEGEIFSLLGPNGAGKTTTIRMLMGVLARSGGTATIKGLDCFAERAEIMRFVGYVPDEPVFYESLTGREILRFVGEMHGMKRAEIAARAEPLVARLELGDAVDDYASNYSHGMKKKLALAAALLHDPEFVILDEPTNGLDPFATRTVHEILREMTAAGKSVFFSTHLLDQAEKLSTRVAILNKARLAAVGRIDELRMRVAADSTLEEIFFAVAR